MFCDSSTEQAETDTNSNHLAEQCLKDQATRPSHIHQACEWGFLTLIRSTGTVIRLSNLHKYWRNRRNEWEKAHIDESVCGSSWLVPDTQQGTRNAEQQSKMDEWMRWSGPQGWAAAWWIPPEDECKAEVWNLLFYARATNITEKYNVPWSRSCMNR